MGVSPSSLTLEGIATVITAVGLVAAYFITSRGRNGPSEPSGEKGAIEPPKGKGAKKKKKKGTEARSDPVAEVMNQVPTLHNIPGGSDLFSPAAAAEDDSARENVAALLTSLGAAETAKEKRGKKNKKRTAGREVAAASPTPKQSSQTAKPAKKAAQSTPAVDASTFDENQWTTVNRKKVSTPKTDAETSVTGSSILEGAPTITSSILSSSEAPEVPSDNQRTLAEKLTPKVRKTAVDDMLEEPNQPSLSRVMRILPEASADAPVGNDSDTESDKGGQDLGASGVTDDDGFVSVISKGRRRPQRSASSQSGGGSQSITRSSETMNKKQRQRLAKQEAEKANKAANEQDRLQRLASHRKQQEKAHIEDMYKTGRQSSGGMSMSVDDRGKAVWD